ncbi:MAG: hypothetical protein PHS53_00315 [Candidatus Pacebacteria bacterium]|nr:hypothetical protein [Candidatus Paceibacterota bacterium]
MKYYGRAEETAQKILDAFMRGDVAKAIAPIFVRRKDCVPCRSWSWGNQLLCALNNTNDARGMRQWNAVERTVKKGAKSFDILVPMTKAVKVKDEETGEEKEVPVLFGVRTAPVFAIEVTEGAAIPPADPEVLQWINSLPLLDVARAWGLNVEAFNGKEGGALGKYVRGQQIALGVKNLSTWAHELIHAADDRLGHLIERGQHWRSETVAELGGAVLLEALGFEQESDRGGCFKYIERYAEAADIAPMQACLDVLKRTCDAVNLLLAEAGKLTLSQPAKLETINTPGQSQPSAQEK